MAHKVAGQESSRFLVFFVGHTFATLNLIWRGASQRSFECLRSKASDDEDIWRIDLPVQLDATKLCMHQRR